jgi:hypothetical protein
MPPLPRNIRILRARPEALLQLLAALRTDNHVVCRGLPPDARLVAVQLDPRTGMLDFYLASATFSTVLFGQDVPVLEAAFENHPVEPAENPSSNLREGAD